MRNRTSIGLGLLAAGTIFLAGCAPKNPSMEGITLLVPQDGISAIQVKSDNSGLEGCRINGNQIVTITRDTFWSPNTGSGDDLRQDLKEVKVKDTGSCRKDKSIFLSKEDAEKLQKEGVKSTPEGKPIFVPLEETKTPTPQSSMGREFVRSKISMRGERRF
ncbi:MAG: hypothetical protein WC741_03380 [Patescibacteria group bacterium]|jgi:hypothetical protein